MKISAAILTQSGLPAPYAASRPLEIRDIDLAGPGLGEVLVEIRAAGLCHSDLSVIEGNRPRPLPMALGHEAAGIVVAVGPGVDDLVVGDHVACVFVPSCGACVSCAEGRPALCEPGASANGAGTLLSGARRLSCEGVAVNHHLGVSAFATHATLSRRSLVKIDRTLAFEHAALFGCAVLTGVGAVVNAAAVKPGTSVAVIGLGGVGLAALLGARAAGAERIIAVDRMPAKLQLALDLGATDAVVADEDAAGHIRQLTCGGVDQAIELAGAAPALELAYWVTRRGGTVVTAGLPGPNALLSLPAVSLVAEEKTIRGSYLGSCVPARDIPRFIRMFQRGLLPVDRLLTHRLPLSRINEGFDLLRSGEAVRTVVTPD